MFKWIYLLLNIVCAIVGLRIYYNYTHKPKEPLCDSCQHLKCKWKDRYGMSYQCPNITTPNEDNKYYTTPDICKHYARKD